MSKTLRLAVEHTQPAVHWIPRALFVVVKRSGREGGPLLPSAEVENEWSCYSTPVVPLCWSGRPIAARRCERGSLRRVSVALSARVNNAGSHTAVFPHLFIVWCLIMNSDIVNLLALCNVEFQMRCRRSGCLKIQHSWACEFGCTNIRNQSVIRQSFVRR